MQTHEKNTFVCDMNNNTQHSDGNNNTNRLILSLSNFFLQFIFMCYYVLLHIIFVFPFFTLQAAVAQFDCGFADSCAFIVICLAALCGALIHLSRYVCELESQGRWRRRLLHQQRCNRNLFCSVTNLKFLTNIMIKRRVLLSLSFAPFSHFALNSKRAYVCGSANALNTMHKNEMNEKYFQ